MNNNFKTDLVAKKEVLNYTENDAVRKTLITLDDASKEGNQKGVEFLVNCGYSINGKNTSSFVAPIHNVHQSI